MSRGGARVAAYTAVFGVLGILVTAWSAGWLRTPRVIVTDLEPRTSLTSGVIGTASRVVVRDAPWRPVQLDATLRPLVASGAGLPVEFAIDVAGAARETLAAADAVSVRIELPRIRGVKRDDAITLSVRDHGPRLALDNVSARYPPDAWMLGTALYAAMIGAWVGWWRLRTSVSSPWSAEDLEWRDGLADRSGDVGGTKAGIRFRLPRAVRLSMWTPTPWPFAVMLSFGALAIVAARKPDAVLVPQFWAEDGVVFFRDARLLGIHAIVEHYAGYWHLFPRIVAAAVAHGPASWAPGLFVLAAAVPVLVVAGLLASPRLPLATAERMGCMALTVLPPMPGEVLLNITNAQWVFGFVFLILLFMRPPAGVRGLVADVFVMTLIGLTGPFVLVFAPLFVARAFWRPSRGACWTAAAASGAAVVQGVVLALSGRIGIGEPVSRDVVLARLGERLASLVGVRISEDVGFLVMLVLGAVVVLAFAVFALKRAWVPTVTLLAAVLLLFAVVMGAPAGLAAGGERYYSLPLALVLWCLLLARSTLPRAAPAALGLVLLVAAPALFVPPLPDLHWSDRAACLDTPSGCVVPINPEGWSLDLRK